MFKKILIANRGEVALRILRACRDMGIETVVAHSTADAESMPVMLADESVCIGPAAAKGSYLNMAALISAATITGAEAIHPGIGFLAENAAFAEMVREHGLTFIGPSPEHIRVMGDKVAAKHAAISVGIPVVPGSKGALASVEEARELADQIGYPVLIKAAAGGGGKGMKVAWSAAELQDAFDLAQTEAQAAFGNAEVYLEKYLAAPRHIEIQILGDMHGNVVHLGERDCSLQRRHQKVMEEAPSPGLTPEQREFVGNLARDAARKLGYYSAGTFEFLFENGEFYFIEMNTRLQVEHPVTEMITGIDLVREQILVAAGGHLPFQQEDISFTGHAIECRINAENPDTFIPSPGRVTEYSAPGGPGVRIDSHLYTGYQVPPHYDSLIAKLIVHAPTREQAIARTRRALAEYAITGVQSIIPLHERLLTQPAVQKGQYDIRWLEKFIESGPEAAAEVVDLQVVRRQKAVG